MRVRAVVCFAVAVCLGLVSSATATVMTGDASAAGVAIGLTGPLPISTGLVPAVSVSSPPPGSANQTLFDLAPLQLISSGEATVNASTDVDTNPGNRTAAGDATILDLQLDLTLLITDVISISAAEITSAANVAGDFGALNASGGSTFSLVEITIDDVTFSLDPNYAPNTQIYNQGGIVIIGNQQIVTGNGTSLRAITVNALNISFGLLGIGGSIIIGQSQAALTAIPEPGTALLLGIGLVAMRFGGRR